MQTFLYWLTYTFVLCISKTLRFEYVQIENKEKAITQGAKSNFALALWHEHLFSCILAHAHQGIIPLASLSKDGDVVSFVLEKLGYQPIRGSSSRGGQQAREQLITQSQEQKSVAITIDGPRGPRRQVKGGIIDIARKSGTAILPVVCEPSLKFIFWRSWDKFQLPMPFSRVKVIYGDPLWVQSDIKGVAFGEQKQRLKKELFACEKLLNP